MGTFEKILFKLLSGQADSNFEFSEIRNLLTKLGFEERIKGDHHIFYKKGVKEIINLQPKKHQAKSYQVKQVRDIIIRYRMGVPNE
jgi:predicted RNA binding protein YcfA (HicA-like mRNA interferase family)